MITAQVGRLRRWFRAASAVAVGTVLTAQPATVLAQEPAMRAAGTYEITWFSVNTVTEQPTVAKLLLVLAPTVLPDSLSARMRPGRDRTPTSPPPRACWRITEGAAAMNSGPSTTAMSTDWSVLGADSVAVQLWFFTDAGSMLRFRLVGDSLRGMISSSGWMRGPGGRNVWRAVRDSVVGRRVGAPDVGRCHR
jgi:hypothetical protein